MAASIPDILASETIKASAPCRVDMGGTLDIRSFYYPLASLGPCTVNFALNLRTTVRLLPYQSGAVKVSSSGFESAAFRMDEIPLEHPLGLMLAIGAYFQIDGIHMRIDSPAPVKSALGGSSVAAVAAIGAYQMLLERLGREPLSRQQIARLAHGIEEGTAAAPCGMQDQLAAVYGGVHAWHWKGPDCDCGVQKEALCRQESHSSLDKSFLLAYCGVPHESKNINGRWIRQFLSGRHYRQWMEILECTQGFAGALRISDFEAAAGWMNRETDIRCELTPDVLDDTGRMLVSAARDTGCGARFCGAGGGGCVWAVGNSAAIGAVKRKWQRITEERAGSRLIAAGIDWQGLQWGGGAIR
ncbi:MAG TPA: galactokinase [Desulfosalsimonadaceae bacterium]|nr:galactokinase [Desulfosalsimonadaceae bacterium]